MDTNSDHQVPNGFNRVSDDEPLRILELKDGVTLQPIFLHHPNGFEELTAMERIYEGDFVKEVDEKRIIPSSMTEATHVALKNSDAGDVVLCAILSPSVKSEGSQF